MYQQDFGKRGKGALWFVVGLALVVSIAAFFFALKGSSSTSGRGGTSNADVISLDGSLLAGQLTTGSNITLGSQGTMWDYVSGGSNAWQGNVSFTATSSVLVSVANPSSATTSIEYVKCKVTGGNLGTSQTMDLSTSTTGVGSSTPALVAAWSGGNGTVDTFLWQGNGTTTKPTTVLTGVMYSDGHSPFVLAPNQRINLRIATSSPSQGYPAASLLTGSCSLVLQD